MGGKKFWHARHLQTKLPPVRRTSGRPVGILSVLLPSFVSFHRRGFIAQIISFFSLSEMTIGWWVESLNPLINLYQLKISVYYTIYRRLSTDLNSTYKNDRSFRIWKIGLKTKLESPQIVGKLIFPKCSVLIKKCAVLVENVFSWINFIVACWHACFGT